MNAIDNTIHGEREKKNSQIVFCVKSFDKSFGPTSVLANLQENGSNISNAECVENYHNNPPCPFYQIMIPIPRL